MVNEGTEKVTHGLGRKKILIRMFEKRPGLKDGWWHPPEIRHKDQSKYHIRSEEQLPKKDLEWVNYF